MRINVILVYLSNRIYLHYKDYKKVITFGILFSQKIPRNLGIVLENHRDQK